MRIDPARSELKWPRLDAAIRQLGDRLRGHYVVISEARIRSRPLIATGR
jgi:hypothetical protein